MNKHMLEELGCKCTCMWCTKNEHEMCGFDCNLIPPNADRTGDRGLVNKCKNCSKGDGCTVAITANNTCPECGRNYDRTTPQPELVNNSSILVKSNSKNGSVKPDESVNELEAISSSPQPEEVEAEAWHEDFDRMFAVNDEISMGVTIRTFLAKDGHNITAFKVKQFISNLLAEQRKEIGEKILKSWNTRALLDYADHLITNQEID